MAQNHQNLHQQKKGEDGGLSPPSSPNPNTTEKKAGTSTTYQKSVLQRNLIPTALNKKTHHRTNSSIRCPQVRVIAGEANEILPTEKAIQIARSKGLDLIEVAPNANPPVCKIADYGKFLYELEKSKPKVSEAGKVKEIGLHANVAEHDLQTKIRHAQGFLERKLLVLFRLKFRGRENAHRDLGESLLQKVVHHLQDIGHPDPVKIAGNNMLLRISPKS